MKKYTPLILLTLLALLVSGCEFFPYVTQPTPAVMETSLEPTALLEPTAPPPTVTLLPPSLTPTPTDALEEFTEEPAVPTPVLSPDYTLQEGSPITLPNFNHPAAGCDWLGVAGQVFNAEGLEVLGLTVQVGDIQTPNENPLERITGEALAYGLGGYEIQIAEEAFDSSERFWIQVLDKAGTPLTARHRFDTNADCENNLVLINFVPLANDAQEKNIDHTPTPQAYP